MGRRLMTMRTGKFLIAIAILFYGVTAHSDEDAENYYSWKWNPDEFIHTVTPVELRDVKSEKDCYNLLARKPLVAVYLNDRKYAKHCMTPMVTHLLSWFPKLDQDIPWEWEEHKIRTGEEPKPGTVLSAISTPIIFYCQDTWPRKHHLIMRGFRYEDRMKFLSEAIEILKEKGKQDMIKAVRRGIEMRVKEGLYHPKKVEDTSPDTGRGDEGDMDAGEDTAKSFGKMPRKQPGQKQLPSTKLQTQDESQLDSHTHWTMWILGILAILSAVIVSILVIRRRGR